MLKCNEVQLKELNLKFGNISVMGCKTSQGFKPLADSGSPLKEG